MVTEKKASILTVVLVAIVVAALTSLITAKVTGDSIIKVTPFGSFHSSLVYESKNVYNKTEIDDKLQKISKFTDINGLSKNITASISQGDLLRNKCRKVSRLGDTYFDSSAQALCNSGEYSLFGGATCHKANETTKVIVHGVSLPLDSKSVISADTFPIRSTDQVVSQDGHMGWSAYCTADVPGWFAVADVTVLCCS